MLRYFGISLLMLGLLGAGYDGFRQREQARNNESGSATHPGGVHTADLTVIPPW